MCSEHNSTLRLGNASNPFTEVEDLALFFLPIIFKPYCVSKEIQSICFCFFKTLLFCKSYLMSQSLMSLNKATSYQQKAIHLSLQGINETRTSGILDPTDLYHISRVSFFKEHLNRKLLPNSFISQTLQNVVSCSYLSFQYILILTTMSQLEDILSEEK